MMNNESQKTAPEGQKSQGYEREYIVYLIRSRSGQSLSQNSREHHLDRSAFAQALCRPWPKVEQLIAKTIGEDPWVIWPERYNANRQPIRKGTPHRRRVVRFDSGKE